MRLTTSHTYAADPAAVFAMMTDPEFLKKAAMATGASSASVADGKLTATLPAPPQLTKIVGPTLTMEQWTDWGAAAADGSRAGTIHLTVVKAPVRVSGTVRLAPVESGTRVDIEGDLTIAIPLLGGALEKQAAPIIDRVFKRQQRAGDAWLTAR